MVWKGFPHRLFLTFSFQPWFLSFHIRDNKALFYTVFSFVKGVLRCNHITSQSSFKQAEQIELQISHSEAFFSHPVIFKAFSHILPILSTSFAKTDRPRRCLWYTNFHLISCSIRGWHLPSLGVAFPFDMDALKDNVPCNMGRMCFGFLSLSPEAVCYCSRFSAFAVSFLLLLKWLKRRKKSDSVEPFLGKDGLLT